MESLKSIAARQQANRPVYFDDPQKDHMLAMILQLAEEVCVLQSRVETCVLLSKKGQSCTNAAIDQFEISPELQDQRLQQYTEFHEQLMSRLSDYRKPSDE